MKLRLTVSISGQPFQQVELEGFERVRIGRAPECEVQLDNAAVSRFQCEVRRHGELLRVVDGESHNGTVLNGVRIESHKLEHGDVLTFGKVTVEVEVEGVQRKPRESDRVPHGTMTLDGDPEGRAVALREAGTRVRGYLTFDEKHGPRHVPLDQVRFVFGRDPDADQRLGWRLAPRLAAVILREDLGFRVLDLSPRQNCVRVNGQRASDVRLNHDDALKIRRLRCRFRRGRPS